MSKISPISNYFYKVSRQTEVPVTTDGQTCTAPQASSESINVPQIDQQTLSVSQDSITLPQLQNQNVSESSQDICKAANLIQTPNQPSNINFPKKLYGKQYRSVQSTWFKEFPWLHYDEKSDSLFCYVCSNQYLKGNLATARCSDGAFISNGFSNWKKALQKFKEHQTSECHKLAVDHEIVLPNTNHTIVDLSISNAQQIRKQNRHYLAKVIETIQYLARQGIAFRGDNDEESNFYQLLKLRVKDDGVLASKLKDKEYISHDIQNEIIGLMSNEVMRDLLRQIADSYFSLICDEYTDVSNKEQLSLCLRWIDSDLEAHEDFLGFYQIPNISADTITLVIQDALTRLTLSTDKCRGQCYDGASNMLGAKTGVATRIQKLQPKAYPTHCHGHSLSLGVKDAARSCKVLSDTMDTSKELITLIKYSPKREHLLGEAKDNIEGESCNEEDEIPGIVKFCPTRWTVTATCYKRILDNYASLFKVWDTCLESKIDTDTRARILGCQAHMKTFHYFFGLHISQRLFAHTDNLSKSLQAKRISATTGQKLASLTLSTLESIRNDESFNSFYDVILIKAKEHQSLSEPKLPRKRRAPTRYELGSGEPQYPSTPRDYYRAIFFEALDCLMSAIKERFKQPAFLVYKNLESLLVNAAHGNDIAKEMDELSSHFSGDVCLPTLEAQLSTFKVIISRLNIKVECFDDILSAVQSLSEHERHFINHVIRICQLIHVNPATSSSGERSFSTARRVKTWLRSRMQQARFSNLAILNTHKIRLDSISLVSVANAFVALNDKRNINFGSFTVDDFN